MAVELNQANQPEIVLALRRYFYRTFRALRYRNFRLYFTGELLSVSGTWMQNLALGWLVYRLTNSPLMLGVIGFARLVPMLFLGLAGGTLADRFDRRKILFTTQSVAMLASAALALLTSTGKIHVGEIVAITALIGIASAFELPAQHALMANIVQKEELVNAVSLHALTFNAARTVAPALAGFIVCWWGESVCFGLNALSYVVSLSALAVMKLERKEGAHQGQCQSGSVAMAIKFAFSNPSVRNVLALTLLFTCVGMQYVMLLPVFSTEILNGQATTYGFLTAAVGVGAFSAALIIANVVKGAALDRVIGYAMLGFFLTLMSLSFTTRFSMALPLMLSVAFFAAVQLISSTSLIQLAVPDKLRGKVVSIYLMLSMGAGPFGSLVVGWIAGQIGVSKTLWACSFICGFAGLIFLWAQSRSVAAKSGSAGLALELEEVA